MNLSVSGGVNHFQDVDRLEAHGGVFYIKGTVESLELYGGIVYDQRSSNRVEIVEDTMTKKERNAFNKRIDELRSSLTQCQVENARLREKLLKVESPHDIPPDDVLVSRITSLRKELDKMRQEHKRETEDLNERISVAVEVNARLRHDINDFAQRS